MPELSYKEKEEILRLYEEGLCIFEIARRIGKPYSTVYKHVRMKNPDPQKLNIRFGNSLKAFLQYKNLKDEDKIALKNILKRIKKERSKGKVDENLLNEIRKIVEKYNCSLRIYFNNTYKKITISVYGLYE